jgi:putative membrane protein
VRVSAAPDMFFLLRLIINAVALLITAWIIPGIHLGAAGRHPTTHDWVTLLIVALIFGVVNAVIRPILILVSLPLEIFTLGLFIFVINAFMLLLTSWIAQAIGLGVPCRQIPSSASRGTHHLDRQLYFESCCHKKPVDANVGCWLEQAEA